MKYSIILHPERIKEWGLNLTEAVIFSFCYELPSWADAVVVNEITMFRGNRRKASEEMGLDLAPDTIYRTYKKLHEKGLIVYAKNGNDDLISLTPTGKTWVGKKSEDSEKNPSKLGKKSESHIIVYKDTSNNPPNPHSGGTDFSEDDSIPTKKKEKPKRSTPQPPSPPDIGDFAGFANPDVAMEIWAEWIEYKKVQHKKSYKLASSERTAINELLSYSGGSIQKARSIVKRSIANTWSGLFPYDEKTAISSPIAEPGQKIPEDTYQLSEELQSRYELSTKWFYEKCHLCAGVRWLSKEEYEKIQNKDGDFIGAMWSVHCKSTEFSNVIRESLKTLNQLPRWDKEKWLSVYEWLKKDVSDRIFKEGNYEQS